MFVSIKKITLLLFLCFCVLETIAQNNPLDKEITLKISNRKLEDVLEVLEKVGNFTFVYNNEYIDENKILSVNSINKSIRQILLSIFGEQFVFQTIGNQVIITKNPSYVKPSEPRKNTTRHYAFSNKDTLTVVVFDTIKEVVYDTTVIIVFDTIKIHDSLALTKKHKKSSSSRYSYEMYFSPSIISFPQISENSSPSLYNKSNINFYYSGFGARVNKTLSQKFKVFGSLEYGESVCNLNYEFDTLTITKVEKDSMNYWKYNKVLTYYKYIEGYDTIWVTLYDSTKTEFNYQISNTKKNIISPSNQSLIIRYITIPIGLEYELFNTNKFSLSVGTAIKTYFIIHSKGYYVDDVDKKFTEIHDNTRRINASYSFFTKTKYELIKNTSIFCEPYFNFFVSSNLKKLKPIIKDKYLGLNIGFSFVF